MSEAVCEDHDLRIVEQRLRVVLQQMTSAEVEDLLALFDSTAYMQIPLQPTGLVMVNALDAFQTPFHLGEVLVSVAEVEYDGVRAHATVMGDNPYKALLAALVNVLGRQENASSLLWDFCEAFDQIDRKYRLKQEQEEALIASTRVSFDSMAMEES